MDRMTGIKKWISVALCFGLLWSVAAPAVMAEEHAAKPAAATLILEAEDGVIRGNFQTVSDLYAASGAYLQATGVTGATSLSNGEPPDVSYTFTTDAADDFVLYLRTKCDTASSNSAFVQVDDRGYSLISSTPTVYWTWKKIPLDSFPAGEHTLKLKAKKMGFRFDRMVLTSDPAYDPEDSLKPQPETTAAPQEEAVYVPGRESYGKLNVFEAEQGVPGSFYMEAEEGAIVAPMTVYDDETASGGKYIAAVVGSKKLDVAESVQITHARYRINVTEKGSYSVWARIITPNPKSKSTWFSVDKEEYKQLSTSNVPDWSWKKVYTANLDVGYHLVNIKYREAGQQIDNLIVTNNSKFTPSGLGSLPEQEARAAIESEESKKIIKVFLDEKQMVFATNPVRDGAYFMVPAKAVLLGLGVAYSEYDGYYLASRGRDYLKMKVGDRMAVVNGEQVDLKKPPYLVDNVALMMPIDELIKNFDADWRYDEAANAIYITNHYKEEYRPAKEGEMIFEPQHHSAMYQINGLNPAAKVETWTRAAGTKYWKPAYAPQYQESAFRGSFSALKEGGTVEVKVRILDQGEEDIFTTSFKTTTLNKASDGSALTMDQFAYHPEGLLAIPTFENISYYLDVDSGSYTCEVSYRENGGSWKDAYTPYHDTGINQFRGSIVNLKADTGYEVRARVMNGKKLVEEYTTQTHTWSENPPVAKTIPISELYQNGPVVLEGLQGTDEGWIKIVGDGETVVQVDKNTQEAIYISNCSNLILENLTVVGGALHGIHILNQSHDIRVVNCDISGWGRVGVQDLVDGRYRDYEGTFINNDAGIKISDVGRIVVERNYIHDPNGRSQSWNGPTWNQTHPAGPNAVHFRCDSGVVIRYNDFVGSDEHRWNDCLESYYNGYRSGGPAKDVDIYGNYMVFGADDSVEFDGGQMNARMYENKVEGFLSGMSTAPNLAGPSYIFRNLFINQGDETGKTSAGIKHGGGPTNSYGMEFVFHNTFDISAKGLDAVGYGNDVDRKLYKATTRNNIILANRSAADPWAINDPFYLPENSFDYDLIGNRTAEDGAGGLNIRKGEEAHAVFGIPSFEDITKAKYHLQSGSIGVDKGVYLPNFCDGYTTGVQPDMGALEAGSKIKFLPYRPLDAEADTYQLNLSPSKTEDSVTIKVGDIPEGSRFTLRKNLVYDWITVTTEDGKTEGAVEPNSAVTFKVTVDPAKIDYTKGHGAVLFRLDSGLSVPVTVYCTK